MVSFHKYKFTIYKWKNKFDANMCNLRHIYFLPVASHIFPSFFKLLSQNIIKFECVRKHSSNKILLQLFTNSHDDIPKFKRPKNTNETNRIKQTIWISHVLEDHSRYYSRARTMKMFLFFKSSSLWRAK